MEVPIMLLPLEVVLELQEDVPHRVQLVHLVQ
jgi:hypothetical protein